MAVDPLAQEVTLRIGQDMMSKLQAHLFPGDNTEHAAVLGVSVVTSERGTRLLARRLFLATDGIDYVPGHRGYRMLTAAFVGDRVLDCESEGLGYLAIHCHGGSDTVGFSRDDLASHDRGYPALLDILGDKPAGALVFAQRAAAGDIWFPDGQRKVLDRVEVVGIPHRRLTPRPTASMSSRSNTRYDRQARLFGDRGQDILGRQKVAVIGAGGAGSLVVELLSHLGIGELVVIDPDRIDRTNLSRVVGSRKRDVRPWLTRDKNLPMIKRAGRTISTYKVRIARRLSRRASPRVRFQAIPRSVTDPNVAAVLTDCDYVFLAADSMEARLLFNAVVHQFLIPGVQVGAKAQVAPETGEIVDVFSVSRQVLPGRGCLWCNGLILPSRLQEEATDPAQRRRQRYVDDNEIKAPSVITLNALASAVAANEYLFNQLGLQTEAELKWHMFYPMDGEAAYDIPRHVDRCYECDRRLGAGHTMRLPTQI